ncbi:type II toxin-antitoxin system RelE/ParE family toxin [Plebeiibacterium sediminum]|uniref:Toxin n=1 Tax=Plebeiibacterium sediminum TaxID=2992112 RepID=A0AAE3SFZ9_9BACT|nr:type II toxin-antitoxin system RelE/ParE family toxin [Plebeiobacterium sediminum]MCW3787622.1 type II toxin-antitoxin system RelE/ParE family toxin [Plebeiobacterium sediminum]
MAKFYLTNKAVKDLANIWNYTFETWSENQADNYYQTLLENCQDIAENPLIGKAYFSVAKSLLGLHVNKHIIFYRKVSEDYIEITRILHEMMDLKSHLIE